MKNNQQIVLQNIEKRLALTFLEFAKNGYTFNFESAYKRYMDFFERQKDIQPSSFFSCYGEVNRKYLECKKKAKKEPIYTTYEYEEEFVC